MDACRRCGEQNPEAAVFCTACGRALWLPAPAEDSEPQIELPDSLINTVEDVQALSLKPVPAVLLSTMGEIPVLSLPRLPEKRESDDPFAALPEEEAGEDLLFSKVDAERRDDLQTERPADISVLIPIDTLDDSPAMDFTGSELLASVPTPVNPRKGDFIEELSEEDLVDESVTTDSGDDLPALQELRDAVQSAVQKSKQPISVMVSMPPKAPTVAIPPPLPAVSVPRLALRPVSDGEGELPLHLMDADEWVIGSESDEKYLKDDPYLSPRHASFVLQGDRVCVSDLNSKSGVWWRIRGVVPLTDGDEFMVGSQLLRYVAETDDTLKSVPKPLCFGTAEPIGAHLAQITSDGRVRNLYYLPQAPTGSDPAYCRIGRHVADFTFTEDTRMSGTHAVVICSEAGPTLRDLESFNGTWLRIRPNRLLGLGDAVLIGKTLWRIGRAL